MTAISGSTVSSTSAQQRKVGILLGIGIFLFPIVFVWFLCRKGHSTLSRVIGFGWLVLLFVAAGNAPSSSAPSSNTAQTEQSAAAPAAKPAEAEIKAYTTKQVVEAYDENTVAADMLFKGKRVKVSGVVDDINTDFMGDPYLVFRSSSFMGPQFSFEKADAQQLATVRKGTSVTVICKGKGDVAKTPMFDDCQLVK